MKWEVTIMSKLLSSVLDKVSEDNNTYRSELRNLNKFIDEKTTALIGDVVTISNYTVDFSNAIMNVKDMVTTPISKLIESYAIKDLRSVETVNEQFVDKINDKIETSNINTKEEKENFIQNLDSLLNDKYLEIVKIKRVPFFNEDGSNEEIEKCINEFISYLKGISNFDDNKLAELMNSYKNDVYDLISKSLAKISNLYLNNFVNEVSGALNGTIDFDNIDGTYDGINSNQESSMSEISTIPEIPKIPEIPEIPEVPSISNIVEPSIQVPSDSLEIPEVPIVEEVKEEKEQVKPMDIPVVEPIEVEKETKPETSKKSYDVEEILKIAKSPVVSIPNEKKSLDDEYLSVKPLDRIQDGETLDAEFDEQEIVEEMINRLTKRLEAIKERQSKYEDEERKLQEDEDFVNDLIESSNAKKEELDRFEKELDNKEKELDEKKRELDKKINDVLPFANAIMKAEKEEA